MKIMPVSLITSAKCAQFNTSKIQPNIFLKKNECDSVSFTGAKNKGEENKVPLLYDHVNDKRVNDFIDHVNKISQDAEKYRQMVLNAVNNNGDNKSEKEVKITKGTGFDCVKELSKEERKEIFGQELNGTQLWNRAISNAYGTSVELSVPSENLKIKSSIDETTGSVKWIETSKLDESLLDERDNENSAIPKRYGFKDNGQLAQYGETNRKPNDKDYISRVIDFSAKKIKAEVRENGKTASYLELSFLDNGIYSLKMSEK